MSTQDQQSSSDAPLRPKAPEQPAGYGKQIFRLLIAYALAGSGQASDRWAIWKALSILMVSPEAQSI